MIVFLFDVDNKLLDNDGVTADLKRYLEREVGREEAHCYWSLFEQLRSERASTRWIRRSWPLTRLRTWLLSALVIVGLRLQNAPAPWASLTPGEDDHPHMTSSENSHAFGAPGIEPRWTSSAKEGLGTVYHTSCRIWFTLSHGIINEIYYPTVGQPNTRDLQFFISDGETFCHEEKGRPGSPDRISRTGLCFLPPH